ncbi:MAG: cupin domain-containing protein [Acidobacteria bacterium]|nr:cupin domain-containing protein [Acidobacteriota bacterium]
MLVCLVGIWSLSAEVRTSQAAGAPQQPAGKVITGENTRLPTTDVQLLRIRFVAGARTYWHVHAEPHLVYVEDGKGQYQTRGGQIVALKAGEVAYLPANVPHWHGAGPDAGATLVTVYPHGVKITMLNEVTEEEYRGKARSPR